MKLSNNEIWLENVQADTSCIEIISVFDSSKYGIKRYVMEESAFFLKNGWQVLKVGLTPEHESDVSFNLRSLQGLYDWIIFCLKNRPHAISYHYYDNLSFQWIHGYAITRWIGRLMQAYALCRLARCGSTSRLVLHEIPFDSDTPMTRRYMTGYAMSRFGCIEVFTEILAERLVEYYPFIKRSRIRTVAHERYIINSSSVTKAQARDILGLDKGKTIYLCIGFLAPQKGFLEAMREFNAANPDNAELWVVGETHGQAQLQMEYLEKLNEQAVKGNGVNLHNKYVSDEEFDLWIISADYALLPYTSSLNSGVGARAMTFGTKLIVSNMPTLRAQLPSARCFENYQELRGLFIDPSGSFINPPE